MTLGLWLGVRGPLAPGFYPEVELRVPSLRLAGRADLLAVSEEGCDITDYKTGAPDAHHADQVRLYALLWSRDDELNPNSLPVRHLKLAYPSHDVDIDPPSNSELDEIAVKVSDQIRDAEAALLERPPARVQKRQCAHSAEFDSFVTNTGATWQRRTPQKTTGSISKALCPSQTVHEVGCWRERPTDNVLLLRTSSEVVSFGVGDHLRLLDLHREHDSESALPVGTLTNASEVFSVEILD